MPIVSSPLHRAIDAGRWDAERPLGRLIVLVHAAFLDAGFVTVPHPHGSRRRGPVPRQVGAAASALSLRYTVPQLLYRQQADDADAVAVLRIQSQGRHLILYVQPWDPPRPVERCVPVDALAAAALLAGGLDATARALRRDAALVRLWSRLSEYLGRRALADLCRRNGVALEPGFMSLPDDAKAAILARLTDGVDLARVERVCAGLRRLVADRDRALWKPRYDALRRASWPWLPDDGGHHSPELSWKERYVWAQRWKQSPPRERTGLFWWLHDETEEIPSYRLSWPDFRPSYHWLFHFRSTWMAARKDPVELPQDPVPDPRKFKAAARSKRGRTPPSSRYRWKHR